MFQPLMEWLTEKHGLQIPPRWTGRSRCAPRLEHELGKLTKEMDALEARTVKKASQGRQMPGMDVAMKKIGWDPEWIRASWRAEKRAKPGMVSEEDILDLKDSFEGMVICPLDKCAGEGMVV